MEEKHNNLLSKSKTSLKEIEEIYLRKLADPLKERRSFNVIVNSKYFSFQNENMKISRNHISKGKHIVAFTSKSLKKDGIQCFSVKSKTFLFFIPLEFRLKSRN